MRPRKDDPNYMANLVSYIKKNSAKGYDRESLKWALVNQGHARIELEKAFKIADSEMAQEAAKAKKAEIRAVTQQTEVKIEMPEKKSFWQRIFG